MLDSQMATKLQIRQIKRTEPLEIMGFSGAPSTTAGQEYAPFVRLVIDKHETFIACEIGKLEDGINMIIPGGWFLNDHPLSFERGKIQVMEHHCDEDNAFEWDDELTDLDDPNAVLVGRIGATAIHPVYDTDNIPKHYEEFFHLFSEKTAAELPPHRNFDHAIDVVEGKQPPFGPIYSLSQKELEVLREYLDRMIAQGKIQPSKSPAGAPILFVPKPNGKLRLCVDYRALNDVTIKNRYPLPLMNELRDRVAGARIFTKLDLRDGYYLIRIKKGDEWKTAFRTRYGHFEYTVMPFGLANAPASFQNMMNEVLREFLDQGVVVYIDDVLIYSENEQQHIELVKGVLAKLAEYNLAVAAHKSIFHVPEVEFLGYILNEQGVTMSERKVEAVKNWEIPKSVKDIQRFLGFANFYRRFIKGFSGICRPITQLLRKDTKFEWKKEATTAFTELKESFTSAPILRHFNPDLEVIIETDASNFAIGCVLSQKWEARLHPVAFHSRKMTPAEMNYDVHDKELLALVVAFQEWHHYCHGAKHTITVLTDHQNLRYFTTTKKLNGRQARWAEELSQFDFKVIYRPGIQSGKPDALSRRSEYAQGEGEVHTAILKPEQFVISVIAYNPIYVKRLNENGQIPFRGSDLAAGVDLHASEEACIPPLTRKAIGTGISIAIPDNTYARIAPRSGLAAKHSIDVGAGVVDADYRGEIKVLLINQSAQPFTVKIGDRIAQLILERIELSDPMEVDSLEETGRGDQGFGSTGGHEMLNTARISSIQKKTFIDSFLEQVKTATKNDAEYQKFLQERPQDKNRIVEDDLIYYKGRLQIPNDNQIRLQIASDEHDSKIAGHFGQKKTLELISRNFYWPEMDNWIKAYTRSCEDCQRNKSPRHARFGLLQPLELPYAPWISTSVDFITALPESEGHTQIMVTVDRFTKMAHFVPLMENATARDCATTFLQNIWKLHGLPENIVSDRDTKWTGEFWQSLCERLKIKRNLSTAFHPQTDGQTERVNQTVETYLRTFVNYDQNDWVSLLPLAEFAYNNSVTQATRMTPFYANYGYNPRTIWPSDGEGKNPASKAYAHWMRQVHERASQALKDTRASMSKYYDKGKQEHPKYEIGDLVMLNAKNIRTKRPTRKLAPKLYGPFKILEKIGKISYRLELQSRWRIHNVFHASLLEPYRANTLQGRAVTRPEPEEIEGEMEYEVEEILQSEIRSSKRKVKGRVKTYRTLFYLVKWKGYPEDECSWEPGSHLGSAEKEVERFHQDNPKADKL